MSEKELERFLDEERVLTVASLGPNGRPLRHVVDRDRGY